MSEHEHKQRPEIQIIQARVGYYRIHKVSPSDETLGKLSDRHFAEYVEHGKAQLADEHRRSVALSVITWCLIIGGFLWWGSSTQWFGLAAAQATPTPTPSVQQVDGTLCTDGWVSHSTGHGTCSHHGGEAH